MLKLDLSPGQSVRIGSDVVLTLEKKTGQVARLAIDADRSVPIRRVANGEERPVHRQVVGITGNA
ncbi:MAG TPA: carbon storage regulator [Burkholderiaceae bacterium]|nr:carbon storage regulator [Burkholderiaceae bacterium]